MRIERQQTAVDRRTFVVTTRTAAGMPDADVIARKIRAAALDAVRDLSAADARALGEALIAKAAPGRRPADAIARALGSRLAQLPRAAQDAIDSGALELELTAKPAVPRRGGRTRAQLLALVQVAARGLVFHSESGLAVVPGFGPINVSVARALADRGDIELDADQDDLWRLTDSGNAALAAGLEAIAAERH